MNRSDRQKDQGGVYQIGTRDTVMPTVNLPIDQVWTNPAERSLHAGRDVVLSNLYNLGGSESYIGCRVYHSVNQSLTNITVTKLAFDTDRYDVYGFHDTATNNTRITIPAGLGGMYHIAGMASFAAHATGERLLRIILNNATLIGRVLHDAAPTNATEIQVYSAWWLIAGDYVELQGYQDTGGALNVLATAATSPEFMVIKA